MPTPEVFTGDDWDITLTVQQDGSAYDLSTATDVSAAVVSSDDATATILVPVASMSAAAPGADWASGVVVLSWAAANTSITQYGARYIEMQITIGGKKKTWPRIPLVISKGLVP